MDWQNILFATSLLTLLALSNAGGDHVKGGGHIKGGSEAVQHPVIQEEHAPSTHNFNTKSSDAFGAKVIHTKTGDQVISPSNAKVAPITKAVLGAPPHPLQSQDAVFLSTKTSPVVPVRDPVAHPVATEQTRKTVANPLETQPAGVKVARRKVIKTIRRKPEAAAQVKTILPVQQQVPTSLNKDDVQIVLPDTKTVAAAPKPITKTASTKSKINRPPLITIDGSENDAGREVIVLEDGTIVDAKDTSRLLGQTATLVPDGGVRQGSTQTINQDFKMVRGSQIPSSDILPNFERRTPYADLGLKIEPAAIPIAESPELLNTIVVPGGPGGPLTLTETEVQNILSSGGIVEFPVSSQGSFSAAGAPLAGTVRTAQSDVTIRSNVQSVSQTSPVRKPTVDRKRTDFKTQTATVTSSSRGASGFGTRGGSVVVPGGPGGASFSLTEDEIQKILSSGGIVEFPAGSPSGVPAAGLNSAFQGGVTSTRSNVQAVSQTSSARKPTLNIRPVDQKRTEFKTQTSTVTSSSRGASVSGSGIRGGSVVVPGGPGGASFSLTEDEIQKILSSGGIVEFPADGAPGSGLSTAFQGGVTSTRSNVQAISQTSQARKPTGNVRPIDKKRTEFKTQTSTSTSRGASVSGSGVRGGSVVVPGGPGGASFSLTEDEIQKILSSGGIVEFPVEGVSGAGLNTAFQGGVTSTRSNVQAISQTKPARKPTVNVRPIDQRRTEFKTQTSTVTSATRGASVSGSGVRGGSVVVPGGPGGASFSLTEDEIQKILSSGGIVEFPVEGVSGAGLSTAFQGGVTTARSGVQAISQTSPARKPIINARPFDQRRTEFKSQTSTVTSSSRGSSLSGSGVRGGSVVVPGGPGGASFSLTEDEIQKILSSGGIVEFPVEGVSGAGLNTAFQGGVTSTLSNVQAISQTSPARKPTVNIRPIDQKRTEFKTQTSTSTSRGASVSGSGVRGGSVVVPGGPGGASFSLTEDEIQKILSSGGIVEFPAEGVPGTGLSTAFQGGVTSTRSNVQAVSQTSPARKPIVNARPFDKKRTEFKSQTSTVTSSSGGASVSGSGVRGGSVVVPGGPGGASFSLTEDEIQKILSSGGIVEFPAGTPGAGSISAPQRGITGTRSDTQLFSQASPAKKPYLNINRNTDFKRQDITSSARRTSVSGSPAPGGSVIVPGGPGGASFTLTEDEIQKILSSGGVVEFPTNTPSISSGGIGSPLKETRPDVSSLRSSVQSLTRTTAVRKPTSSTSDSLDRKRTEFKSQTSSVTSNTRRTLAPNAPSSGGPIIVTGGPGGASLTLSEEEINRILESGGMVEFPVDAPTLSSGDSSLRKPSLLYSGENKQVFANRNISPVNRAQGVAPSVRSSALDSKLNAGQVHMETVFSENDPSLNQEEIKPAFAQGPEFTQQQFAQEQVPNLVFKEGDVQLHQTPTLANSPVVQALVADSNDKQTQVNLEDPLEQKHLANDPVLSQFKVNPLTLEKRLVLDNLSSKYLQEKVPVDVPGYVPPPSYMSPFNYRVPHLKSTAPIVQEQQKMEQILI